MSKAIIDSAMTLEEGLAGTACPSEIKDALVLIDVTYISFDDQIHQGQLIVHTTVADEVQAIFEKLLEMRFPIEHAKLPVIYGWDDDDCMAENDTSAFNYRVIQGTDRLSNHSFGLAIDINPALNPYTQSDGLVVPPGSTYDPARPGTLTTEGPVVALFKAHGWGWGGDWERKDWQHFEKPNII